MADVRRKYLFIRLLEACNADCFMCGYAMSRDDYRFSLDEFSELLPLAHNFGVKFVRFTGGEPLIHRDLPELVRVGTATGMQMSLITNGALLPRQIGTLSNAGLAQVIVSVDGATAASHDRLRNTKSLFRSCLEGLRLARQAGLRTRVNTVVGPHNYGEMPELQRLLTELGVEQWELSALKLERPIAYADPEHVLAVCEPIYAADPATWLVPMGKRFYGNTAVEQATFFAKGHTPRPSLPVCLLVGDVIYLDAKNGRGYGCSLLPHRDAEESGSGVVMRQGGSWQLDTPEFSAHTTRFRSVGPTACTGCSTTAAGYSDHLAQGGTLLDWSF